jgi:hypothetical protein
VGVALLAVGGLLAVFEQHAPAQTAGKKAEGKKAEGKADPKKKAEVKFIDRLVPTVGGLEQITAINEEIRKKWEENKLTPAPRCTDYEFIRRASLDLIGRIAKRSEIEQFLRDPAETRRSQLIERLMDSEDFAHHWANVWTVLLMTRSGALNPATKDYHNAMRFWLEGQFEKKDLAFDQVVTELLTASGKTNENGAVNFLLSHMGERFNDRQANPREMGKFEMVPATSRVTRLFLGLRTQCTQCHDHPFNDVWLQSHFWGINAFLRQLDAPSGRPLAAAGKKEIDKPLVLVDNPELNVEGLVPYERRNGVLLYAKPTFIDGQKPAKGTNRRQELARFVTKSDYFSKAMVNRLWGHFFGRGFTKDVDDFGDHNPVSHPELLDKLASDWATKYRHNPRDLIRWICNSEAYGLSSVANETNDKAEAEPYFSRILLKAMTPEQLFESLMVATQASFAQTRDNKKKLRDTWMGSLIVNFGNDEGEEATFNGTVVQALLLMNGTDINNAIMDKKNGTVAEVLSKRAFSANAARTAMADLFLAALNRPPRADEVSRILQPRMYNLPKTNSRDAAAFWTGFYQDLMWALLNSNEFMLNH